MSAYNTQVGGNHYQRFAVQPFEFFDRWKIPAGESYAIKYLVRHRWKNGEQDIRKALHCLNMIKEKQAEHSIQSTSLYQNSAFENACTDYYQVLRAGGMTQIECDAVMYILRWIQGGDGANISWAQLNILDILQDEYAATLSST